MTTALAVLLAAASPTPNPSPTLRQGLETDTISPGLIGFVTVFVIALACIGLFLSMTRKIRGVRFRDERALLAGDDSPGGAAGGESPSVASHDAPPIARDDDAAAGPPVR